LKWCWRGRRAGQALLSKAKGLSVREAAVRARQRYKQFTRAFHAAL